MADIGQVSIRVVPSAQNFVPDLLTQIRPGLRTASRDLANELASQIPGSLRRAITEGLKNPTTGPQGSKQGEQFGSAFERAVKTRLRSALGNLPDAKVGVNATEADARLAQLRRNIGTLSKTIGVHISDTAAVGAIEHLRAELAKLQHSDNTLSIRVNAGAASAELAALQAQLDKLSNGEAPGNPNGSSGLNLPSLPITAILSALPLIGPLAGAATGALGGVVGAGGAAGLAIKGLNNEIHAGTDLGRELQGQLGGLKGILGTLESTAAHASSGGILSALDQLHKYAPELNPVVANIARNLGRAGSITAGALITALKVATPLLEDGGRYAAILAQKLATGAASPEFRSFIDYARRELPIVGNDLLDLGKAGVDVAKALAPVGEMLLTIIDDAAKAVDAVSRFVAFMKGSGFNGIGGGTPANPSLASAKLGSSIGTGGPGQGSAFFGGNSPSNFQKGGNLVVSGLLGFARGNTTTSQEQNKQLAAKNAQIQASAANAAAQDREAATVQHAQNLQAAALIHTVQVLGTTIPAYNAATAASAQDAAQLEATTFQMVKQNNASGLLRQALDKLDGKQLSAAQSQNQFEQALVGMAKKVAGGDAAIQGLTSSAVANRGELLNLVTAAESAAGTTGDLTSSSEAAKKKLLELRDQIIRNAVAHGEDKKAVTDYINTVLDVNKLKVRPTLFDISVATALAKLATLKAEVTKTLLFIDGQVGVVHLSTYNPATHGTSGGKAVADGGFISGPGSATSDSIRARLSNGEFVVRASQTAKHRALLEHLNTPGFADGGIVTLTPSPSSGKKSAAANTAAIKAAQALATAQANIRFTTSLDLSGLLKAAAGSSATIAAAMRKLITDVHTAVGKQFGSSGLISTLQVENRQLQTLANERTTLTGKLKAANNLLAAEQKLFSDERAKVAGAVAGNFDITSLNAPTQFGTASPTGFLQNLVVEEQQAQKFAAQLLNLRKAGLNKNLIAQLGEAGVGQAGAAVQSLASFAPAQIKQANDLYAKANAAAQVAGTQVATSLYQAGVDSARGYVNGLTSQLGLVDKAAAKLADTVIKQIKKTLGIKSPSTVAHGLAGNTVAGYVAGVDDRLHLVRGAASRMANAAVTPGQFSAGSSRSDSGGPRVYAPITVNPSAGMDEEAVGEAAARRLAARRL